MGGIAAVLNDSSATGECEPKARQLQQIFAAAGREARVTVAQGGDQLRKKMEEAVAGGCELLVAGGGDGTINTAASLLVDRDVPLGVLPMGTLNHFAKDLGIPLELEEAVKVVLDDTVCRIDVGEVNGHVFVNNSSLGVYPAIVRLRERYQESGRGKWVAALWASLVVLRRNPFVAVRLVANGEASVRRTPFVFIGNNEYKMAGLKAGSRESLVNRVLAVYVLNAQRRTGLLGLAWKVLLKGAEEVQELDLIKVDSVTIETRRRRLQVALDGEVLPLESPLSYRIRPASLQVHVPRSTSACQPPETER